MFFHELPKQHERVQNMCLQVFLMFFVTCDVFHRFCGCSSTLFSSFPFHDGQDAPPSPPDQEVNLLSFDLPPKRSTSAAQLARPDGSVDAGCCCEHDLWKTWKNTWTIWRNEKQIKNIMLKHKNGYFIDPKNIRKMYWRDLEEVPFRKVRLSSTSNINQSKMEVSETGFTLFFA